MIKDMVCLRMFFLKVLHFADEIWAYVSVGYFEKNNYTYCYLFFFHMHYLFNSRFFNLTYFSFLQKYLLFTKTMRNNSYS